MHIGFTGPRKGMTTAQQEAFGALLAGLPAGGWFHHGDCVGADAQAHAQALEAGFRVHIHPPDRDDFRAFCTQATTTSDPRPFLKRNQDIVKACDLLVATPPGFEEQLRSGIWSTVRRARRQNNPHLIIWPDGSLSAGFPDEPQQLTLPQLDPRLIERLTNHGP